ncbi:MAG: GTPase ObgE, partial [Nanoarchaeota archaeon]
LKHIEKTKILVHCISVEDVDPIKSYQTVRAEFKEHNPDLLKKKEIVLLTKKDLISEKELKEKIKLFKDKNLDAMGVSVFDEDSLNQLRSKLPTN